MDYDEENDSINEALNYALLRLGCEEVKRLIFYFIAFSETIPNSLSSEGRSVYSSLWLATYGISKQASNLAQAKSETIANEIFYISMLQKIGISGLLQAEPQLYETILNSNWKLSIAEKEKRVFGTNHYEIGKAIVKKWGLPPIHSRAIEFEETHGNIEGESLSDRENFIFHILYLSKKTAEETSVYNFDPYFEFDDNLLSTANRLLSEADDTKRNFDN